MRTDGRRDPPTWLAAGASVGYLAVWWLHVLSTELGDPLGGGLDLGLYFLAGQLKLAGWLGVYYLLRELHQRVAGRPSQALRALAVWLCASAAVIGALVHQRLALADILSNAAANYYIPDPVGRPDMPGWSEWMVRWQSGEIVIVEGGLAVLLCGLHAAFAALGGRRPTASVLVAAGATFVILIAHVWWFGLWQFDDDMRFGDVYSAGLLGDLVWPLGGDPESSVGSIVQASIALSTWVAVALTAPPRPTLP